jgi:hypothetical protein
MQVKPRKSKQNRGDIGGDHPRTTKMRYMCEVNSIYRIDMLVKFAETDLLNVSGWIAKFSCA